MKMIRWSLVVMAGCAGVEVEQGASELRTQEASLVECYELEPGNAICTDGIVTFESRDLALSRCTTSRKTRDMSCVALRGDSPALPSALWEGPGVSTLLCPGADVYCVDGELTYCWCEGAQAAGSGSSGGTSTKGSKKGKVEAQWKVEEGTK